MSRETRALFDEMVKTFRIDRFVALLGRSRLARVLFVGVYVVVFGGFTAWAVTHPHS